MQLYSALYRMVEVTRLPNNREKIKRLFDEYWSEKK